jgi:RND family efflux transporter MFP subunit
MSKQMKNIKKYLIPLSIVVITVLTIQFIFSHPPTSIRGKMAPKAVMSVEVMHLTPQNYQVMLESFGIVKPRTQSVLTAQVTGQITKISDNFRDGGFFHQGEVLLTIDERDYQAELNIAKASVLSAQQQLLEEQAKVKQAEEDWQRLGSTEPANPLVLRKPQLAAAQAQLLSAQAKLEKAALALSRTKIYAPYDGRVLSKKVDVGQVVSNNTQLADIYATDYVEVRLPINNSDIKFAVFPSSNKDNTKIKVTLVGQLDAKQVWEGFISRTESSIDENSQQLHVVAQIDQPFANESELTPSAGISLKIGQYLEAKIEGKRLENALIIPNNAIYQGSYVYVEKNNILQRKNIDIAWQNSETAVISHGLAFGDNLVLTPLGQVSSGTKVKVIGKDKDRAEDQEGSKLSLQERAKQRGITVKQLRLEIQQRNN